MPHHARRNAVLVIALAAGLGFLSPAASSAEVKVRRTRVVPSENAYAFGKAVALHGRTLVVGANSAVIVLERSATDPDGWMEVARLVPAGPGPFDFFGSAVAVSGDTLVAATESLGAYPGAWLYQRNADGVWAELELRPEGGSFANPGGVAIDGDIAAVGDQGDNASTGAVYLFERDAGGPNLWGQIAKLVPAGAVARSWFGGAVALDGDTLVAGAIGDSVLGDQSGAAFVFQRADDGSGWAEAARLSAPDLDSFDRFGSSVDVDADTIVVGAELKDLLGIAAGTAYVFERDLGGPGQWSLGARLEPTNFDDNDFFGGSVAVLGDQILVGASGDDDLCPEPDPGDPDCNHGAAYVFQRNRGGDDRWGLLAKTHAPQGFFIRDTEEFGKAVDLDGTSAVVGGPGRDNAYFYRWLSPPQLTVSGSCPGTVALAYSASCGAGDVAQIP